jgi:hypothetical protein
MKSKTIKAVLRKKIDAWVGSIEDEAVRKLGRDNTLVTGGAIASMLLNEDVNDFDVYFRNHETTLAVANYYVARFHTKNAAGIPCAISVEDKEGRVKVVIKSAGIASEEGAETAYQYFEGRPADEAQGYVGEVMGDLGEIQETYEKTEEMALEVEDDGKPVYRPVFMSTNAITLSGKIQIVLRFYGEPDAIHENYDFVHCTNYWTSRDNALVLRQPALEALLARELRYVGSKYPVCSVIRLRKFIRRGWSINAGQILKMMMQISALDLTNPEILEDQLTGVDSAYFIQLMTKLREKNPEKVNTAYLVEIIDRMF